MLVNPNAMGIDIDLQLHVEVVFRETKKKFYELLKQSHNNCLNLLSGLKVWATRNVSVSTLGRGDDIFGLG